jgi:hypothetical protein
MAHADPAVQAGEPDHSQPSPIVLEIRIRMAQLDKTDEILGAVASMLKAVKPTARG